LTWLLDVGGQNRALLRTLAQDSIVPYIVEDDAQSAALGQAIIDGFEFIDLEKPLQDE